MTHKNQLNLMGFQITLPIHIKIGNVFLVGKFRLLKSQKFQQYKYDLEGVQNTESETHSENTVLQLGFVFSHFFDLCETRN